jgi:hypothetical protein
VELHCIGGFVLTMQFGISHTTSGIDFLPAISPEGLSTLQQVAGSGSALHQQFKVSIQPVGVVTYPDHYSSRVIRIWPGFKLKNLRLCALEAHDLALTKLERNQDVDRQDVQGLADRGHINSRTLCDRYTSELRPKLLSGLEKHDSTLRLWIEMCWPGDGQALDDLLRAAALRGEPLRAQADWRCW